jgi:hypothetical protein
MDGYLGTKDAYVGSVLHDIGLKIKLPSIPHRNYRISVSIGRRWQMAVNGGSIREKYNQSAIGR